MYCENCGTKIEDGVQYCPGCGTPVQSAQTAQQPQQQPVQPMQQPPMQPAMNNYANPAFNAYNQVASNPALDGKPVLVMGILAIAFASSFFLSLLGIIFGAIGLNKAKQFVQNGGVLAGKSKVGRILSKVGLILGIVLSIFFVIYVIVIVALISSEGGGSYNGPYYYY